MRKYESSSIFFNIRHSSFRLSSPLSRSSQLCPDPGETEQRIFDLSERTAVFAERVLLFLKALPRDEISRTLIVQLVRSATSIGANYAEADDAGSRREFFHRVSICQRESRESMYWLRLLATAIPDCRDSARTLWKEADELNRIFAAIHRKKTKDE